MFSPLSDAEGEAESALAGALAAAPPTSAAPVALDDNYLIAEDTPLPVAAPGVLANDSEAAPGAAPRRRLPAAGASVQAREAGPYLLLFSISFGQGHEATTAVEVREGGGARRDVPSQAGLTNDAGVGVGPKSRRASWS